MLYPKLHEQHILYLWEADSQMATTWSRSGTFKRETRALAFVPLGYHALACAQDNLCASMFAWLAAPTSSPYDRLGRRPVGFLTKRRRNTSLGSRSRCPWGRWSCIVRSLIKWSASVRHCQTKHVILEMLSVF